MLTYGNVVQLRTVEFGMLRFAEFARKHFELIDHVFVLIPEIGVKLIVHRRLVEDANQLIVVEVVKYGVNQGLYLEVRPLFGDEVQVDEEGVVLRRYLLDVNDSVVVAAVLLLADVADFAGLQDVRVEVVLQGLDDLFGVADAHLYLLRQGKEGLFHQVVEKGDLFEDSLVGLLQHLLLEAARKLLDENLLLFEAELFLDVDRLVDVVVDATAEVFGEVVFDDQFLEDFEVFALFDVLGPNVGDQITDAVDVVGEHEAADHLDKDQADRFLVGRGIDVAEPHRQHYVRPPIVGPNVLLDPVGVRDLPHDEPVFLRVYVAHSYQKEGEDVAAAEVEENSLRQGPILLSIKIIDHINLQFLKSLHNLRKFCQSNYTDEVKYTVFSCHGENQS